MDKRRVIEELANAYIVLARIRNKYDSVFERKGIDDDGGNGDLGRKRRRLRSVLLGRRVPRQKARGACVCHTKRSPCPSDMEDGGEDHRGLRFADE